MPIYHPCNSLYPTKPTAKATYSAPTSPARVAHPSPNAATRRTSGPATHQGDEQIYVKLQLKSGVVRM